MRTYKLIGIYMSSYCFFGMMVFLVTFGFEESLNILKSSLMTGMFFSGAIILFSSLLASILIILLMKYRLASAPYPYFILGFYIGNISLLLIFILDALFKNYVIWKFPEVLLIFLAPFINLFFAYLFGFAFMALIPSCLSAYILFKVMQHKQKT